MTDFPYAVPPSERWAVTEASAPVDFTFPEKFRQFVTTELPDVRPLYWLLQRTGQLEFWTETLAEQFPDRVLIPFAKTDGNDDIHCFDGADTTGNPIVLLIHAFTTPGWEYRGEWYHFDSWLTGAYEFHEENSTAIRMTDFTGDLVALSRKVSHALRHEPAAYGVALDGHGWVEVDELLGAIGRSNPKLAGATEQQLHAILATSAKTRFEIQEGRIRARYGHSFEGRIAHPPISDPPQTLYHGTAERNLSRHR